MASNIFFPFLSCLILSPGMPSSIGFASRVSARLQKNVEADEICSAHAMASESGFDL